MPSCLALHRPETSLYQTPYTSLRWTVPGGRATFWGETLGISGFHIRLASGYPYNNMTGAPNTWLRCLFSRADFLFRFCLTRDPVICLQAAQQCVEAKDIAEPVRLPAEVVPRRDHAPTGNNPSGRAASNLRWALPQM